MSKRNLTFQAIRSRTPADFTSSFCCKMSANLPFYKLASIFLSVNWNVLKCTQTMDRLQIFFTTNANSKTSKVVIASHSRDLKCCLSYQSEPVHSGLLLGEKQLFLCQVHLVKIFTVHNPPLAGGLCHRHCLSNRD